MRILPVLLLTLAFACFAFAYWGLEMPGGRRTFDEMAGIVPLAIGLVGAVLLVAAAALWLWTWFRTRKDTEGH